jgi:tRNA threonylcarbamoyladenosine biosynthesis protein TsaE
MGAFQVLTRDDAGTRRLGAELAALVVPGDVLLLTGDLGAGKTVLAKGLAEGLGVSESVTSPTFNIMLVHEGRIPLYHFDLYRLDRPEQLEDVDYFGTLEADGVSIVEWGDRFARADPGDRVLVRIAIEGDTERRIDIVGRGPRGERLARDWFEVASHLKGVEAVPAP